jgi:hypothetical protein
MAEIIDFPGYTKLDLDPDQVLENNKGKFETVVIMGFDHNGVPSFASSTGDIGEMLILTEMHRDLLLDHARNDDTVPRKA